MNNRGRKRVDITSHYDKTKQRQSMTMRIRECVSRRNLELKENNNSGYLLQQSLSEEKDNKI